MNYILIIILILLTSAALSTKVNSEFLVKLPNTLTTLKRSEDEM